MTPDPDFLDIGFPPSDPAVLVADVKASGARGVGLYVINLSAPNTVQTPAYAQAVAAGGVQVVPIITPGMTPPAWTGVPDALRAWGQLNVDNAVAFDIEQPGIDTPPPGWVATGVATLDGAGYQSWVYTNLRAQYPWGRFWAVNWDRWPAPIPAGAVGVQGGLLYLGPSGTAYDQSFLIPEALNMATLDDVNTKLDKVLTVLGYTQAEADAADKALEWGAPHGGAVPQGYVPTELAAIHAQVDKLAAITGADPAKLAAALATPLAAAVVNLIRAQWVK